MYSAAIADCVVRYQKLRNPKGSFILSTGTDEHGSKVEQAAQKNNEELGIYCDKISKSFQCLFDSAGIDYTHFNRTSDQCKHVPAVQEFWVCFFHLTMNEERLMYKGKCHSLQRLLDSRNCIYKANYRGWYCVPDETFLNESQLTENADKEKVSLESGHPVQWLEESNYMFRLSKYQEEVIRWIEKE